ncbi:uncharacterized protein LOC143122170 isoform X2 [Alosa pseudoharengus]|uniref:uncharacterized protein LOC143122170 isoform X2 n=1 Tax=Alosa pseudoharengus TaxID=34774 RepID=UPI003F8C16B9
MAHCSLGKVMVEMTLKHRHQSEDTRGSIGIDCDPEPKTWSILGSFMAFGSDDLLYSAPNTTLDALVAFPRFAPATAPLPSPAATGGLAAPAPEMRDPCGQKCRRQCTAKFSEERRQEIWSSYRAMDFAEKRMFVFHSVSQLPTARSCGAGSRRGRSFVYRLKNKDQVPQQVCKTFFLATLGFHPTNDSLVLSVMRREIGNVSNLRDQRGRHPPANKLDMQPVYDHIESFHPSVSHYGREQAPHSRYLPRDITIKLMYDDALVAFPRFAPATAPLPSAVPPGGLAATTPEMRDPCGQKCRRQCTAKFSEERRQEIWSSYWGMDFAEKRMFVFHSVSQLPTARSCGAGSRRGRSFVYRLKNKDQVPQQVCKTFFLATLGFHPTNDSLVLSVMRREIGNVSNLRDQRGRHPPANKLDMQPVYDHIESFHPSVSHYGREQAPHCRYLPRDITVKLMYADYVEKGNRCSYETYRKAVKQKNISFCKARGDVRSACWP